MKLYQQAFGEDYDLGIKIPEYFVDQSYKNDSGPSFVYSKGVRILKICLLPERISERDIDGACRYTLMLLETSPGDDYQEVVGVPFESESSDAFQQVIFDQKKLDQWLN